MVSAPHHRDHTQQDQTQESDQNDFEHALDHTTLQVKVNKRYWSKRRGRATRGIEGLSLFRGPGRDCLGEDNPRQRVLRRLATPSPLPRHDSIPSMVITRASDIDLQDVARHGER